MKKKSIDTIGGGLKVLHEDPKDFLLGSVFDQIKIETVPRADFEVAKPFRIKDQGETDFCSSYAVTSSSEDQEGVELLPEYTFFHTKLLMDDFESWGADLRTACKSMVKFGSLPVEGHAGMSGLSRAEVLEKERWGKKYLSEALKYAKETYFKVTGRYDTFDNIRAALWQFRKEKRTLVVGALWRPEWTTAYKGIVPKVYSDGGFGHAFKIFGQKLIEDEIYLMAQLSNGTDIGDNGIFYFPRAVVNKEFAPYGQFMFKDMPRKDAEFYMENNLKVNDSTLKKYIVVIINFIKAMFS